MVPDFTRKCKRRKAGDADRKRALKKKLKKNNNKKMKKKHLGLGNHAQSRA